MILNYENIRPVDQVHCSLDSRYYSYVQWKSVSSILILVKYSDISS